MWYTTLNVALHVRRINHHVHLAAKPGTTNLAKQCWAWRLGSSAVGGAFRLGFSADSSLCEDTRVTKQPRKLRLIPAEVEWQLASHIVECHRLMPLSASTDGRSRPARLCGVETAARETSMGLLEPN